jgi:hypothetical protein
MTEAPCDLPEDCSAIANTASSCRDFGNASNCGLMASVSELPLRADSCRPMMHRNARFPPLNPLRTLLPEWSWTGLIVAPFVTY